MFTQPDRMITYKIPPSFIDSAGDLRQFQTEIVQFASDQTKRVAILDAPTASGKTHGFRLVGEKGKTTLIVFPNNLLSRETGEALRSDGIQDTAVLNASSINAVIREKRNLGSHDFTQRKAIGLLLENKRFVITNPTVFYNMLHNHYSQQSREDMLSELIRNNLAIVIFDEFHVYTRDQASMILASTLLLRSDIKLMFASATIPDYLPTLLKSLFGEDQLSEIRVKRSTEKKENSSLLQGQVNVHIFNGTAIEFVHNNWTLFRTGKWFLILDSIRNIHDAKRDLLEHFPNSEFLVISAYDDPSYGGYASIKSGMIGKRIIIGSNIVEQGINPPSEYTNFLIEPGYSSESIIQRSGRIGRRASDPSNLYIATKSSTVSFPDRLETMDDLFDFVRTFKFRYERPPWVKLVGTYLWFMLDKLTGNAKEAVLNNLKSKGNPIVIAACFSTKMLDRNLSDKSWINGNIHYIRELREIAKWWSDYKESIYHFIPLQNEVKALDISDEFKDSGGLATEYSELWLKKNKGIVENKDGLLVVKDFLSKPDFDFSVNVSGLPFSQKVKMRYGDIYFNARKEIIERFNEFYKSYFRLPDAVKETLDSLGKCIESTAGPERLRLELP